MFLVVCFALGSNDQWNHGTKRPSGTHTTQSSRYAEPAQYHPLIPVRVTPWMNWRWAAKNRRMTGSVIRTAAAIMRP